MPSTTDSLEKTASSQPDPNNNMSDKQQALLNMLDEWMADESGFDELTWPVIKKTLAENRTSPREMFDDKEDTSR